MTIENTQSSVSYSGGFLGATLFPTTFAFFVAEDLTVKHSDDGGDTFATLVLGDDYDVDGAGEPEPGGTVVLVEALTTGQVLVIERNTAINQLNSFRSTGPLPVATIEASFDKLTMIAQENRRRITQLEALGNLVDVGDLANGEVVSNVFTTSDPVEDTFPFNVAVADASSVEFIIAEFDNHGDASEVFDEIPQLQWGVGDDSNISIMRVSGLKPGVTYTYRLLLLRP